VAVSFEPDDRVVAAVNELHRELRVVPFDHIASWAGGIRVDAMHIFDPSLRHRYSDAVRDLVHFIEEIRFEIAFGALLVWDWEARRSSDEGSDLPPTPMPVEALALLAGFMAEPPTPVEVFRDPHFEMSGNRVLSLWVAGQMLDSAMYRSIAALDRLAIILWVRAGRELSDESYPAFRTQSLGKLNDFYVGDAWDELRGLLEHPIWSLAKDLRDVYTHRHRYGADLLGTTDVLYDDESEGFPTAIAARLSMDEHLAILRAFYDLVLRPAIRLTGEVVGPPPGEDA
jgi:hypothetical protein